MSWAGCKLAVIATVAPTRLGLVGVSVTRQARVDRAGLALEVGQGRWPWWSRPGPMFVGATATMKVRDDVLTPPLAVPPCRSR